MECKRRVRKNKTGKPTVTYYMDYTHPVTGERERPTLKGIKNKEDADRVAAKRWREMCLQAHLGEEAGPTAAQRELTLGAFLEEDLKRPAMPRTLALERHKHKALNRILGENTPVADLSLTMLKMFQVERLQDKVTNKTVNDDLAILRAALNRARKDKRIHRLPCEFPDRLPQRDPERRFLVPADVEKLLAALYQVSERAGEQGEAIYRIGGLRPDELWSLEWRAVDFAQNRIRIVSTKTGSGGDAKARYIPMGKAALKLMKRVRARAGEKADDPSALVFGTRPEDRLGKYGSQAKKRGCKDGVETFQDWNFSDKFKKAARLAQLADPDSITPYVLRHSAATNSEGADITDVSYMIGHADPRLTMKLYRHVRQDRVLKGLESLEPGRQNGTKAKAIARKVSKDKG